MSEDEQEAGSSPHVRLYRTRGHLGVVARRPIRVGQVILRVEGCLARRPSRYSLQVGEHAHIAPPDAAKDGAAPKRPLWCYLNHSCAPSACFEAQDLIALRDIARGEEINFDYNTTEYEIAEPFLCGCGTCGGVWIRGFRHLDVAGRFQIAAILSPHLKPGLDMQRPKSAGASAADAQTVTRTSRPR